MTQEKKVDWDMLEVEYRAGIKSFQQLGEDYGVSKGRISQVAKKRGWTRDLSERIRAKADAKVNEAAVNAELNAPRIRLAEQVVVEANADLQFQVRMRHRRDLADLREVACILLEELKLSCSPEGQAAVARLQEIILLADADPDDPRGEARADKMREELRKAMSLSTRIENTKKLAEIQEKIIKLETETYGLKAADNKVEIIEDLLDKV